MKQLAQFHLDRWAMMVDAQKKIEPFPLTLGEILKLWGFKHRRGPQNTLDKLKKHGYIRERRGKRYFMYYAIDPMEERGM
jgi:hypothetical protein